MAAHYMGQGKWLYPKHIQILNETLVSVKNRDILRLIIMEPPRFGKSFLTSGTFPAWHLGHCPDENILHASYEHDASSHWGGKARDLMCAVGPTAFDLRVRRGERAKADGWQIEGHEGHMYCSGVGGPMTGKGGHLLIDDPVKNAEQANSIVYREKTWDWFITTAYTRIEPGCWAILIMTRWHEDDLAGRLIKQMKAGGEKWHIINFPAIAEEEDQLGRKPGEHLWPERFTPPEIQQKKQTLGAYWFRSLYQQRPSAEEGTIFKRQSFRYYTEHPTYFQLEMVDGPPKRVSKDSCRWFQVADTAMKKGLENSYTVIGTFVLTHESDLLVYDIFRDRLEVPDQYPMMKRMRLRYPNLMFQCVEDKASGTGILQTARRDGNPLMPLRALMSKKARASEPINFSFLNDKIQYSAPASVAYENGCIYHRVAAPWLTDFEDELLSFDKGAHDDQVDVIAYAWLVVQTIPSMYKPPLLIHDEKSEDELEDEEFGFRTRHSEMFDYDEDEGNPFGNM